MFPIALQLYSIRDDMQKDFEGSLKKVKAMGYDGVEFAGLFDVQPAKIKAMLSEIGLVPISAHVPHTDAVADPAGVLGAYAEIGCKYIAIPYLTEEYRMGAAQGEKTVADIRALGETARSLGMTLLYHNHDFEFEKMDGEYKLDLLYKAIPAELLQAEIDTCWVNVAGENPCDYLRKYAGRAPVVHLKDFHLEGGSAKGAYKLIGIADDGTKSEGNFEFRTLGKGMQDVPAILKAAKDAKAQWIVVEQDEPSIGHTRMQCAELSMQYLKSL